MLIQDLYAEIMSPDSIIDERWLADAGSPDPTGRGGVLTRHNCASDVGLWLRDEIGRSGAVRASQPQQVGIRAKRALETPQIT